LKFLGIDNQSMPKRSSKKKNTPVSLATTVDFSEETWLIVGN
jgi:hypothetical protein